MSNIKKHRRVSEKQLANLKPFPKGHSGNPGGRPKSPDCLISCIKAALAQVPVGSTETNEQLIADILVSKAAQGDIKAIELLMTYTTPKPAITLAGDSESPLAISFIIGKGYDNKS